MNRTVAILLLSMFATGAVSLAEVSTDQSGDRRVTTLLMDLRSDVTGMTDGADPIPNVDVRWNQYRRLPEPRVLNHTGALRDDGRPAVAFYPRVFTPVVVWSYNRDTDHDVAIAEWTPQGWSETRFLAADRELDQVDPRIFIDRTSGLHVVWAVRGPDPHIVYMRREGTQQLWREPVRVTPPGEIVGRPSVATVGSVLVVAYERVFEQDGQAMRGIVVRRLNDAADGTTPAFDLNRAFPVPRQGELDPILHVRGGQLWLDWKHTDAHLGWAVFQDQAWSGVRLFPWLDPSWIGVENARKGIEHLLLAPKRPDPYE